MATKKKILITCGPTWVAIDSARVISNIATGQTGFILAKELEKSGYQVKILSGPGNFNQKQPALNVINFTYFNELKTRLMHELKHGKYQAVIHAAAVSDYRPKKINTGKLSSGLKNLKLDLVPTEKLINRLRSFNRKLFTVGFKFEPNSAKSRLFKKALNLLKTADLNLVVANSNRNNHYCAYILDGKNKNGPFTNKNIMAKNLAKIIRKNLR